MLTWIWIPLVLAAAGAQTVRNAAQRSLVKDAGTLPATFVRFVYGLPFALLGLACIAATTRMPLPHISLSFVLWVAVGAISQLVATAFLLEAMGKRSFVVAVAFSKTEILQIGILSIAVLGEPLTLPAVAAIALASVGVVLLSYKSGAKALSGTPESSSAVVLGLASGAGFALSAVGYRAAALTLEGALPWVSGIYALAIAQSMQSFLLGSYLLVRDRAGLLQVIVQWRASTLAGFMGALASMGWLTAFAMRSAVDVRIVGLVEVFYSYALSRKYFKEPVTVRELGGMLLVMAGIVIISVAH